MSDERRHSVEDLFHTARELSTEERSKFLDQECATDPIARSTIETLLREDARAHGPLDGVVTDSLATTLSPGMVVGPYEVVSVAGIGGMGQVYRAVDRRLKRDVAIKALPVEFTRDRERLQRLQGEATVLASLNNPNVAAIYDVLEREDEPPCLVLEFVPGATLAEALKDGPFEIEKTLKIAHQIATALEAAHNKGIVHRDLKPSNIKTTPEGMVKILDFGLATVLVDGDTRPPYPRAGFGKPASTYSGLAGTPSYMSPEQAQGLRVDQRTDIWAFGCVLYEMLTGRKAFDETSVVETGASVFEDGTDWTLLPTDTPSELRLLLRQCLQTDVNKRIVGASVLRKTMEELEKRLDPSPAPARSRLIWAVAAAVVTIATVSGFLLLNRGRSSVVRVQEEAPLQVTFAPELELDPAVSPDGTRLAYVFRGPTRLDVYVRKLDGGDPINLTKELQTVSHRWPQWSPDGSLIAFVAAPPGPPQPMQGLGSAEAAIHVVPWQGGSGQVITRVSPVGHAWSPGGVSLAFVRERELYAISLDSMAERKIADAMDANAPSWSPDGKWIAFTAGNSVALFHATTIGNLGPSSISIVSAEGGESRFLIRPGGTNANPVWMPDSRSILYVSNGGRQSRDIFQLQLSADGEAVGDPARITAGLNALSIHLSADGRRLAYSRFRNEANLWSLPVPESGSVSLSTARPVTSEVQTIEGVSVSHDGKWIAFDSNRSGNQDIYRMPREGGKLEQLTTDPHDDFLPSWSLDGKFLAFYSFRNIGRDIYVMNSDGSNQERVTADRENEFYPVFSPDGQSLVFQAIKESGLEVYVVKKTNGVWGQAQQVTSTDKGGQFPRWSPDGRTIVYIDVGKGLSLISPDGTNPHLLLSAKTSLNPGYIVWPKDSDTIYFKATPPQGGFWSVKASGGPPKQLVRFDDRRSVARPEFATDGKDFFFTITERASDVWVLQLEQQ